MAASSSKLDDDFVRRLHDNDPALIESRCERCGLVIVGSVLDGLAEKEAGHKLTCPAAHINAGK